MAVIIFRLVRAIRLGASLREDIRARCTHPHQNKPSTLVFVHLEAHVQEQPEITQNR